MSKARLFKPRVGDVDGTNGGDENVGRDRDGDPDRLDVRDAREEGRVPSSTAAAAEEEEAGDAGADVSLLAPPPSMTGTAAGCAECVAFAAPSPFNERGAKLPRMLLPSAPLIPGDIALVRGDSVHTRAVVLVRAFACACACFGRHRLI